MSSVRTVHTADLTAGQHTSIRALLDRAFDGKFEDADWEHSLGGMHVVVAEGDVIVAHGAVVQRRLLVGDRPLRAGYVEGVAVDVGHRGRGHARAVMDEAERVIRGAYELGALSAAEGVDGFYAARGWLRWRGRTAVLAPAGFSLTPDEDDSTFVFPVSAALPEGLAGTIACDWRSGDVW
jgi:aminoglycoside 2'-N-acetyltransferase I